ncbi:MAG: glutamate--tRNA ligase [Deltaproteobacteria bacterium]|nr:glutamate--tRNA ligase [Deltaproteobacteria bacterium]
MAVRTRFAPSPTGILHVGGVRTALFNWLFARRHNGSFILRMEDTDTERSGAAFERAIMEDLIWLGLGWDEGPDDTGGAGLKKGPYRQSERLAIYAGYAKRLVDEKKAYRCWCSRGRLEELKKRQIASHLPPRYDGRCRDVNLDEAGPAGVNPAIRFRMPAEKISFNDMLHGEMDFDGADIGDFVITGSDNIASYNFAAAIDDALMEITHVIRGEDHLSNTPRQIALLRALGLKAPRYMHLGLVTSDGKIPIGKREGGLSIKSLREAGWLPEAVINATARLGWSPPPAGYAGLAGHAGAGDFLTLDEMAVAFDAERLSKSPSAFDMNTLKRFGRLAMERSSARTLAGLIAGRHSVLAGQPAVLDGSFPEVEGERLEKAIDEIKEGAATLNELAAMLVPVFSEPALTPEAAAILVEPDSIRVLKAFKEALAKVEELDEAASRLIIERLEETGLRGKKLFLPVRAALTGEIRGIELNKLMVVLGKDRVNKRLMRAINRKR